MSISSSTSNGDSNKKWILIGASIALATAGIFFIVSSKRNQDKKSAAAALVEQQQKKHAEMVATVAKAPAAKARNPSGTSSVVVIDKDGQMQVVQKNNASDPNVAQTQERAITGSQPEKQLTPEEQAEQDQADALAIEIDSVFTTVLTNEILSKEWHVATALLKRAKELLPIAERFIEVEDDDETNEDEAAGQQANEQTKDDSNKLNNGNNDNDDDEQPSEGSSPSPAVVVAVVLSPLGRKIRDREVRVEFMIKQERQILQELKNIIGRVKDTLFAADFEDLPQDDDEKIKKAKSAIEQLQRVEATLDRLHVPSGQKDKLLELCSTIKEVASEYDGSRKE